MEPADYKLNERKWRYTLMTTVLYLIITHPVMFKLTHRLFGSFMKLAGKSGCPTMAGYLLHAVVFTVLLRMMMNIEK